MTNPFSATGAFTANPSVSASAKLTTPYTEEYNLAIEHQFQKGLDVRIGYVGQHNLKQNNYGGSGNYAPNINLPARPCVGDDRRAEHLTWSSHSRQSVCCSTPSSTARELAAVGRAQAVQPWRSRSARSTSGPAYLARRTWRIRRAATPQDSYGPVARNHAAGACDQLLLSAAVRPRSEVLRDERRVRQ